MDRAAFTSTMDGLIDGWCAKRNLKALRLVLPTYPLLNGLTDDWAELHTALKQVRVSCRDDLEAHEMDALISAIHQVQGVLER